jgi:amino acid transporter
MPLSAFWRQHFLRIEGAIVVLGGCTVATISFLLDRHAVLDSLLKDSRAQVYTALAAVFGSLLGFIITALSLALGFSQNDRMKLVRDSKHYGQMWDIFTKSIFALALTTGCALCGLVLDKDRKPAHWIAYICMVATLLAISRVARCIWLLEKLVAIIKRPPRGESGQRPPTDAVG